MTLHTYARVQDESRKAGFSAKDAEIFAAVCMAESITWRSGVQYCDDEKIGDLNLQTSVWGPSVGVPQIRTMKQPTSKNYDYLWLFGNLGRQLEAAFALFKARGFSPWSAYNNSTYLGYLPAEPKYNPKPVVPANVHLILGGQSLSAIAQSYRDKRPDYARFSWQALALANGLSSPYWIFAGKTLKLPTWPYKIVAGDTLSTVAERLTHLTWQELATFNKITNPNVLAIGQELWIPDVTFLAPTAGPRTS